MNAILQVFQTPLEMFEYGHSFPESFKTNTCKRMFTNTSESSKFYGNQDSVYGKFMQHKVKDEAALVSSMSDELKSIDFEQAKWLFRQRLEEGDSIDVNRFLDGQDKYWSGVRRSVRDKRVIRIFTNIGGNCDKTKEQLAVNGAIAVTLCEILESLGIGVELWGCSMLKGITIKGENLLSCVKIKDSSDYSDLGIVNYITGDNHVFRNTMFRCWTKFLDGQGKEQTLSLGYHTSVNDVSMFDDVDSGNFDGTIVVPSIFDIPSAREWVVKTLKERIKHE